MNRERLSKIATSIKGIDLRKEMLNHRMMVLCVIIAMTVLFAAFIPRLEFKTSTHDLVIETLPENRQYELFKEIFGSEEIIRVVIKCDNVFDPLNFQKIAELEASAKTIAGVQRVIGLPSIRTAVDLSGKWSMEKFSAFVSGADLFKENLISDDHRTTLITLVLKADANQNAVIDAVRALIDATDPQIQLYQIGMPLISRALAQFSQQDFLRLPPFTFLIIALMLLLIFKRALYAFIPLSCVCLCLIWTFGAVAMLNVPLSILTMIVPVFLIAVGTAYCLHVLETYREACRTERTAIDATILTYTQMSLPTLLAIATTLLGLASLFVNRISAIREFALCACIGMVAFLILIVTYLPVFLSFIPPDAPHPEKKTQPPSTLDRFIGWIVDLNLNHQRTTLIALIGIALLAGSGLLRLRAETNPVGFFKADTQVVENFHDIYRHLSGSFPINVVMTAPTEDYFENAEHIADLARLQQFLEQLPGVDKTLSFADYIKLTNYASNRFEPEHYRLPSESWELRMLLNTYKTLLGADMYNAFMGPALSQANILLLTHISSSRDFLDLRERIHRHVNEAHKKELTWDVTGFGIVISASSHQLVTGFLKSFILTMVVIFIIMFALFLSLKVGLIAIVTNLFPIIINFGLLGWFGIELSIATGLIASIAIGLAVDDTIHYLVRFNREFHLDLDEKRAIKETLCHIGRPIIFTTLTIATGFFILSFSGFKPTAIFGTLMVTTMLSALAGDMILLPILMQRVELVTLWDLVRIKMGGEISTNIPLFKGMSRAEVQSIIMAGKIKTIDKDEVLFFKGDHSESMYAIISGNFDVINYDPTCALSSPEGIQKCIAKVGTGDILGEMGLLRSAPHSATVKATEPGELLPISWKVISRLQWLYPPTAQKFFVNMMNILCDRVERLSTCLANESLVDDLTRLNNKRGFCRAMEQEMHRAERQREILTMVLLEIDFVDAPDGRFNGAANDMFHKIGVTLCKDIRRCDMVGRIDTNAFVVLIPSENDEGASVVMDRLRDNITAFQARFESTVGFSIAMSAVNLKWGENNDGEQALEDALRKLKSADGLLWSFATDSLN